MLGLEGLQGAVAGVIRRMLGYSDDTGDKRLEG